MLRFFLLLVFLSLATDPISSQGSRRRDVRRFAGCGRTSFLIEVSFSGRHRCDLRLEHQGFAAGETKPFP
jgi:hypothetical protein